LKAESKKRRCSAANQQQTHEMTICNVINGAQTTGQEKRVEKRCSPYLLRRLQFKHRSDLLLYALDFMGCKIRCEV
jgi:hypothetical protein